MREMKKSYLFNKDQIFPSQPKTIELYFRILYYQGYGFRVMTSLKAPDPSKGTWVRTLAQTEPDSGDLRLKIYTSMENGRSPARWQVLECELVAQPTIRRWPDNSTNQLEHCEDAHTPRDAIYPRWSWNRSTGRLHKERFLAKPPFSIAESPHLHQNNWHAVTATSVLTIESGQVKTADSPAASVDLKGICDVKGSQPEFFVNLMSVPPVKKSIFAPQLQRLTLPLAPGSA